MKDKFYPNVSLVKALEILATHLIREIVRSNINRAFIQDYYPTILFVGNSNGTLALKWFPTIKVTALIWTRIIRSKKTTPPYF